MMIQKGLLGLAILVALPAAADSHFCFDNYMSTGGARFHFTIDGIQKYWESTVYMHCNSIQITNCTLY